VLKCLEILIRNIHRKRCMCKVSKQIAGSPKCRVKPEGEGITEMRVWKVRAKRKPNYGNVLACGLYMVQKSMQKSEWGALCFLKSLL
jgi:hypothetical protein